MASAIVNGLISQNHFLPEEIGCFSGSGTTAHSLAQSTGITYLQDPGSALAEVDIVVVACKPQQFNSLNPTITTAANGKLFISVLAGTTLRQLDARFPGARNIVRTMPNTPGQIGEGSTAYSSLRPLSQADEGTIEGILRTLGNIHSVDEASIDAVTALSGSGPAYIFEFAAALQQAGMEAGLPSELATALTNETLLGAAKLLNQSNETPDSLIEAVTSPGGTTAAGLKVMKEANFRRLVSEVVTAAKKRSIELSNGSA